MSIVLALGVMAILLTLALSAVILGARFDKECAAQNGDIEFCSCLEGEDED